MLSTVLEIVDTLKLCLALALLTGLIFGYLYSKLKAREIYNPIVKEFTKNIKQHTKGFKKADKERETLKGEIENYEYKLKGINESIFEYKDNFVFKKKLKVDMLNRAQELNSKYEEKQNILAYYSSEIEKIKKECRFDDVSSIEENQESMSRLIADKELQVKEKQDKFSMIQRRVKGLDLDNHQLEDKFHKLNKDSENMVLQVVKKEESLNDLKKGFVKEYELLYEKISASHDKAKEYKDKLIKLKNL